MHAAHLFEEQLVAFCRIHLSGEAVVVEHIGLVLEPFVNVEVVMAEGSVALVGMDCVSRDDVEVTRRETDGLLPQPYLCGASRDEVDACEWRADVFPVPIGVVVRHPHVEHEEVE